MEEKDRDNDTFNNNIRFLQKVRDVDAISKPRIDQLNLVEGAMGRQVYHTEDCRNLERSWQ